MDNKKLILAMFGLLVLIQWWVPAKMVLDREDILNYGKEFKFRTMPVDPYDAFRGKYIYLNFDEVFVELDSLETWERNEEIYISLGVDAEGFVQFESGSKERPDHSEYLKTTLGYHYDYEKKWTVAIPFDRYYLEESLAHDAELIYQDSQLDTASVSYASVYIKEGEAVIKDVLIDDRSIVTVAKELQNQRP